MSAEKILRKHVALIHAHSQMSALQRKALNVLLYEATAHHASEDNPDRLLLSVVPHSLHYQKQLTLIVKTPAI